VFPVTGQEIFLLCKIFFLLSTVKIQKHPLFHIVKYYISVKAFFNTMDWWDIFPTGPLPLPHHRRKKMAYCPKARALRLVLSK
jgi:hypothetical protein